MGIKTVTLSASVTHGDEIQVRHVPVQIGEWLASTGQLRFFTNPNKTTEVQALTPETTFHLRVETFYTGVNRAELAFNVTSPHPSVSITPLGDGEFAVTTSLIEPGASEILFNAQVSMASSGTHMEDLTRTVVSEVSTNFIDTTSLQVFSDAELTVPVNSMVAYGTYYIKVSATVHPLADPEYLTYQLTASTGILTNLSDGVYKLVIEHPSSPVVLDGTAVYLVGITVYDARYAQLSVPVTTFVMSPAQVKFYTNSGMGTEVSTLNSDTTYFARIQLDYANLTRAQLTFGLSTTHGAVTVTPLSDGNFTVTVGLILPGATTAIFSGITSLTSDGTLLESFARSMSMVLADDYISGATLKVYSNPTLTTEVSSMVQYGTYYAKLTGTVRAGVDINSLTYQLATSAGSEIVVTDQGGGVYKLDLKRPSSPTTLTGTVRYVVGGTTYDTLIVSLPVPVTTFILSPAAVKFYTNSGMGTEVSTLNSDTTYFARIQLNYANLTRAQLTFSLTTSHAEVDVTPLSDGNFSVDIKLIKPGATSITFNGQVRLTSGNVLLESFSRAVSGIVFTNYITNGWLGVYSDSNLTNSVNEVEGTKIPGTEKTYYVKYHLTTHSSVNPAHLTYQISSTMGGVTTFTHLGNGLFSMKVGDTGNVNSSMTINATVNYVLSGTTLDTLSRSLAVTTIAGYIPGGILVGVMGGGSYDIFQAVTTDSANNIICVGYTGSEGPGADSRCLVVKFDRVLGIVARKVVGGSGGDVFFTVATDSANNIICAGTTASEGPGASVRCLVVKFNSSLGIVVRKVMGGINQDYFYGVTTDSSNNIICAGYTASEGPGAFNRCLVVKFNGSLDIVARKVMGGNGGDFFHAVTTDSANNIICAGYTSSEGPGANARCLVVKFNSSLGIVARKVMGGTGTDYFYGVTTDSSNNIICAGYTSSEGPGSNYRCLVVKFNSSLGIVARKVMGGTGGDIFYGVTTDSANNIICAGYTASEGPGADSRCLVVKFNSSLGIVARKVMGGTGSDIFQGVTTDSANNIICVGYTGSEGPGASARCLVVKFPPDIQSGTFTGTLLPGLSITDSTLAMADSALAMTDSALAMADSILTAWASTLTVWDSTLAYTLDAF